MSEPEGLIATATAHGATILDRLVSETKASPGEGKRMRLGLVAIIGVGGMLALWPSAAEAQKKQRDRITAEEIDKSSQKEQDLLAAIRALRPHFLDGPRGVRTLGGGAMNPVLVVVDGARETGFDALARIMAIEVEEVRYLDPSKSQNDYGINANGGAIVVKLKKPK